MDHKKSFIKGALSGALIMLLIVILGSGVWKAATVRMAGGEAEAAQISAESETDKKLNMLSNVIDQYYLYGDDIDEKAMQDGIYKGYASGLGDPYTVYYNEEQTRDLLDSTTGEYSGIGAMMQQNYQTRQVTIGNIYKNSPAEEAGLKTGDILYQVDDHVIDPGHNLAQIFLVNHMERDCVLDQRRGRHGGGSARLQRRERGEGCLYRYPP